MSKVWTESEKKFLKSLKTPAHIQEYIDSLKYNTDDIVRSPRHVIRTKKAHCFDGALFAACALDFHSEQTALVALYANGNDDDHVITTFRRKGYWGAIAKSNYVPIRWRDPVYKSLRELVMSYFEGYFTLDGFRTMRAYSQPFSPAKIRDAEWRTTDRDLDPIGQLIDRPGKIQLLPKWMNESWLKKETKIADERSIKGASIGLDLKGIF